MINIELLPFFFPERRKREKEIKGDKKKERERKRTERIPTATSEQNETES